MSDVSLTVAPCANPEPHDTHEWTPEPRVIHNPRRCVGVPVNTPSTLPRVAKPPMVMRSIRVPAALWEAAKAKADERQENISDVIREALERYVKRR